MFSLRNLGSSHLISNFWCSFLRSSNFNYICRDILIVKCFCLRNVDGFRELSILKFLRQKPPNIRVSCRNALKSKFLKKILVKNRIYSGKTFDNHDYLRKQKNRKLYFSGKNKWESRFRISFINNKEEKLIIGISETTI